MKVGQLNPTVTYLVKMSLKGSSLYEVSIENDNELILRAKRTIHHYEHMTVVIPTFVLNYGTIIDPGAKRLHDTAMGVEQYFLANIHNNDLRLTATEDVVVNEGDILCRFWLGADKVVLELMSV